MIELGDGRFTGLNDARRRIEVDGREHEALPRSVVDRSLVS